MMILIARLCAFCAVCTLLQMMLPQERQHGFRMIAGLCMLHLVIAGLQDVADQLLDSQELMHILSVLIG